MFYGTRRCLSSWQWLLCVALSWRCSLNVISYNPAYLFTHTLAHVHAHAHAHTHTHTGRAFLCVKNSFYSISKQKAGMVENHNALKSWSKQIFLIFLHIKGTYTVHVLWFEALCTVNYRTGLLCHFLSKECSYRRSHKCRIQPSSSTRKMGKSCRRAEHDIQFVFKMSETCRSVTRSAIFRGYNQLWETQIWGTLSHMFSTHELVRVKYSTLRLRPYCQ